MTQALSRQLEFPLLVNVNAVDQPVRKQSVDQEASKTAVLATTQASPLEASAEDLSIYRSIGEGFIRQFR